MTTSVLAELTQYRVEIEALLAWFPTKIESRLKQPQLRNTTFRHSSVETMFWVGWPGQRHTEKRVLGWSSGTEDALVLGDEEQQSATGSLLLSLNEQAAFELEIMLQLGAVQASKRLVLEPDTITPFMVNVAADVQDDIRRFTAATLHGVAAALPRPLAGMVLDSRLSSPLFKTG